MPYAAYSGIKELFVPDEKLEEAKQEAEELPSVEISSVWPSLHILFGSSNRSLPVSVFGQNGK